MKRLLLLAAMILLPGFAHAETVTLNGKAARALFEALVGAGFEIKNMHEFPPDERSAPFSIRAGAIQCEITNGFFDFLLSNSSCSNPEGQGGEIKNSLALVKALQDKKLHWDGAAGHLVFMASSVGCTLDIPNKGAGEPPHYVYTCKVVTQ